MVSVGCAFSIWSWSCSLSYGLGLGFCLAPFMLGIGPCTAFDLLALFWLRLGLSRDFGTVLGCSLWLCLSLHLGICLGLVAIVVLALWSWY